MNKVFSHVTYECNAFCKHCAVPRNKDEMNFDLFKTVIDKIDMEFLVIGGGEPLKHSRLKDMIDYASKKTKVKIETNSQLLTKDFLYENKNKLFQINTSIDGLEKTHNSIRGIDTFKHSTEMIKYARSLDIDVAIWSVVMKDNISEFEDIIALTKELNVNKISFLYATPVGKCKPEILVPYEKYNSLVKKIDLLIDQNFQIRIAPYLITENNLENINVDCLINEGEILHIDPKGDIYPCVLLLNNLKYRMGSVQNGYEKYFVKNPSICEGLVESLGKDDRKDYGIPVCPCRTISKEWTF